MQVTLIASSGREKSWTIAKALLAHYSGYFRRTKNFKEGEQSKVILESFEPETFQLFVEFVYFGRYSYRDILSDKQRIRDSVKAWVLGDYLDAVEFKNFALKNLYDIYFPVSGPPKSTIGPEVLDYCCAMTPVKSKLYTFFRNVLIVYWHDTDVIIYDADNRETWDNIWAENPEMRSDLLYFTSQTQATRETYRYPVGDYFEEPVITDDPVFEGDLARSDIDLD
jgi:hypothetical protein